MTDFVANDDDCRWDADRAALFAETEQRSWENRNLGDRWPEAKDGPDTAAATRMANPSAEAATRMIATASPV